MRPSPPRDARSADAPVEMGDYMSDDTQTATLSPEDAMRSARLHARAEAAVMALFTTRAYELGWAVRSEPSGVRDHVTLSCDAGHTTQVTPITALHPKLGSTILQAPEGQVFHLEAGMEHMAVPGNPQLAAFSMALEECEHCARKQWEEAARASFAAYAIEADPESWPTPHPPTGIRRRRFAASRGTSSPSPRWIHEPLGASQTTGLHTVTPGVTSPSPLPQ